MRSEKVEKLVAKLYDKTEYVMHIRNWKQALNHWLVLKKVHIVIKFIFLIFIANRSSVKNFVVW